MKRSGRIIAGFALASFVFAAPVAAQDSGSMQVGNATVTVGGGTAILTLPDVPSFVVLESRTTPFTFINSFKFSDDFGDEIGWNVNGSIEVPVGAATTVSLNGFWANIDDEDSATCTAAAGQECAWFPLADDRPGVQGLVTPFGGSIVSTAKREVDHWGASLELKWQLNSGVMGVTQAPPRRYVALGADIRGIDQDLDVAITSSLPPRGPLTYNEELDTRYYGAYAAWGGDFPRLLLGGLRDRLGLHSTFMLRGGIYYADTDYDGQIIDGTVVGFSNTAGALSLSDDEVAFIGGLVMETSKPIGRRAKLSLKSEYEYYSYVPEMAYNQFDSILVGTTTGRQVGTVINDGDAFSARIMLRLTIKLGPDSLFEEPLK